MEIWPNFFIVGAAKAGTTSLYNYLREIPEVYMSPEKEPGYFSRGASEDFLVPLILDKKKYLKLFKDVKNEKAIGEASPIYLWNPQSPQLIQEVVPNAQIIIILRDPVERLFSEYLMASQTIESRTFHEAIHHTPKTKYYHHLTKHYLYDGMYSESVKRYLDTFGHKKIKIIIFEEFVKDTKKTITEILKFLNVNASVPDFDQKIHNPYSVPKSTYLKKISGNPSLRKIAFRLIPKPGLETIRKKLLTTNAEKPQMLDEDRKFLREFYSEDVKKLMSLLGRDFPWSVV